MQTRSFRDIINEQIRQYKVLDNPIPLKGCFAMFSLFSSSGKEGRHRIRDLEAAMKSYPGDIILANFIYSQIVSGLQSSKKLRLRLTRGLCEYYAISEEDIRNQCRELAARDAVFAFQANYPNHQDEHMINLLCYLFLSDPFIKYEQRASLVLLERQRQFFLEQNPVSLKIAPTGY